jgi:flavin-dependent dehydrogenase
MARVPKDILILGGGPAGLSTALHLAQLAPELTSRVLLLEKARYPRPKLCGGALLPDAEIILERLGLDVREVPHVDAAEAHLDFAGRGLGVSLPGRHVLRLIRRDEFDAWLAQKTRLAGIEILEGVNVTNVESRQECAIVQTDAGTFEALIVVGADGSNGVTRRCVMPNSSIHTARLLELLVPVGEDAATARSGPSNQLATEVTARSALFPSEAGKGDVVVSPSTRPASGFAPHRPDVAYFDFFPVPRGIAGYTWDFPTQVQGEPTRCWGIYDTNLLADHPRPPLRDPLDEEMNRQGHRLADHELQGHPIRWFSPLARLSAPHIILVGDAAGADGIFGEGISIALGYGRIAAAAIRAAIAVDDFSFSDYRRRILLSPLGQALAIRTGITHILYHLHWAWFQKFFWRAFKPVVSAAAMVFVLNWARRMK